MNVTSPWVPSLKTLLKQKAIFEKRTDNFFITIRSDDNTLWLVVEGKSSVCILLRMSYAATGNIKNIRQRNTAGGIEVNLKTEIGYFAVRFQIIRHPPLLLRCTTTFTPARSLYLPFWPRDLVIADKKRNSVPEGTVHISQVGARSGLQYISFDKPLAGSLLYFQNLTSLNAYCETTQTSLSDSVGGNWPELGFALPASKEKALSKNKAIIISDAFLAFNIEKRTGIFNHAKYFLNLLAEIYKNLPRPETIYHDWCDILQKGLKDLQFDNACWSHASGNDYLNAYVCDYETPPEIMVQLAVLMPLFDYHKWSNEELPAIDKIKRGLKTFYDEDIGTVVRWLPAQAEKLDRSEEQLDPDTMDSWYLHHPLLNLGRMALENNDETAKKLFLDSIPFAIKVARHFKYQWPVFYNVRTLEVIKTETKPGEGGEHDVAGLYAHVMLKAWKLTSQKKYLDEAKKAAKTLAGKKFNMFYQANNTAFGANAMLELYKQTGTEVYLDIAYLCIANIFKNMHLWECDYGYAKNYSTFFGVFPLNDAPYTAAYEEQEVFAAFHQFLADAGHMNILPSVSLLLAEFVRYVIQRAYYYYPGHLPAGMLSKEVKTGEMDKQLWIALEDIHDGWQQSGNVGQEVYGAGVAFGIVPRHYYRIKGETFMIYIDYPSTGFTKKKNKSVSFHVSGHEELVCRMMLIKTNDQELPSFTVATKFHGEKETINGMLTKQGNMEYAINGNRQITISWN